MADVQTLKTGIRTIAVSKDYGFQLNGVTRKLKGVCLHHDLGPLGAAENKAALIRQIKMMKQMGCDAIRTAHNMPSTMQMEICDSLGMMVMAESFDMWIYPKCKNGYAKFFKEWSDKDITNLVKHHRNHPCIVMWSIGNGGFSLRKIDSAIQMLEYSRSWLQTDPFKDVLVDWEDLFWAYCGMKKNLSFKIPPKSIALKFSVQDNVSHAYEKMPAEMPFGCHGWYKDNFDFWKQRIQACGYDLSQYKSTSNGHSMRSMFTKQLWRLRKYINVPILYYYLRTNRHEKALHLMLTWLEKYDAKSLVWRNTAEFFICIWRICRAGWMEEKKFIYLLMEKTVKEILCRVINTGVYGVWKIQMLMVLCKHFDSIDRDARYGLQNCLENIANSRWQEFVIDDDISYYLYNIENDILPDKNLQKLLSVYYDGKISEQELLNHIETKTVKPSKIYNMLNDLM